MQGDLKNLPPQKWLTVTLPVLPMDVQIFRSIVFHDGKDTVDANILSRNISEVACAMTLGYGVGNIIYPI